MTRRNGRGFSSAEKTELWDRWQRGESLKAIGRVFGKPSSSIYFQLSPHGGIRPSPRRRSRLALSLWEREEISRGIVARHSIRSMALLLSRSPSTVSREVRRNGGYDQSPDGSSERIQELGLIRCLTRRWIAWLCLILSDRLYDGDAPRDRAAT